MALKWLLHSACYLLNEVHACANGGVKTSDEERIPKGKKGCEEICNSASGFQMPLHYPRYNKADYQKMEEWEVDLLLNQYGMGFEGSLEEKRAFAMGAFLWPDQF